MAVLLGILLLQGSLCDADGSMPCVASCDETETVVEHGAVTVLFDDIRSDDEPGGLVSLCVTVLLAVLLAAAALRRPGMSLSVPPSWRAPARAFARLRSPSLPQLCALRL